MTYSQLVRRLQAYKSRRVNASPDMEEFYAREIERMEDELVGFNVLNEAQDILDLAVPWETWTDCKQTVLDLCNDKDIVILECDKGFSFSWWPFGFHWVWRVKYVMK